MGIVGEYRRLMGIVGVFRWVFSADRYRRNLMGLVGGYRRLMGIVGWQHPNLMGIIVVF